MLRSLCCSQCPAILCCIVPDAWEVRTRPSSQGRPKVLCAEPLTQPTSPLQNGAVPAKQVENFHLGQWVGSGQNKPSIPPERALSHGDGPAFPCPASPSALAGGPWEVPSEAPTKTLVIPVFVAWLPTQQGMGFHGGLSALGLQLSPCASSVIAMQYLCREGIGGEGNLGEISPSLTGPSERCPIPSHLSIQGRRR